MALVLLASATGAPGVTTTALGLALTWPRDVLLCDADRDPAQSVLAGYLAGTDASGRGLVGLARSHREAPMTPESLLEDALRLNDHDAPRRSFLPGFTHPGSAAIFRSLWSPFGACLAQLGRLGTDAIVDAGRIGRDGLPAGLLMNSRLVLVVVRSSLRSLAAARLYLPYVRDHLDQLGGGAQLGLIVVGPGQPYTSGEIAKQFGVPVVGEVAASDAAAVLSDGAPEPRRFGDGPLMRSYRALGSKLRAMLDEGRLPSPTLQTVGQHA